MATSCGDALKRWAEKTGEKAAEAKVVKLCALQPPIAKMDAALNELRACEWVAARLPPHRQLSLSTNSIDRLIGLPGLRSLRILSLARNQLRRVEKLEDNADTLEELWLSYNSIASVSGITSLRNLTTLYMSNNKIASWQEIQKLAVLPNLRDVLFVGNPIYEGLSDGRLRVLKFIPQLKKIDGDLVTPKDVEDANALVI